MARRKYSRLYDDPTRALVRVTLSDLYDPSVQAPALLNPQTLQMELGVAVGKMHPIGSSHPTLQYGYTEGVTFSLEFYLSTELLPRVGGTLDLRDDYVNWFTSFCYPAAPGEASHPLLFVWSKILAMAIVVEKMSIEYGRFFADDLAPAIARVNMQVSEYRVSFKTSSAQRMDGFQSLDPILKASRSSGTPLRLRGNR